MRSLRTLSMALTVVATILCPSVRGGDLRNFEDAALYAVQFWDNREGWAVGDEGVIWHTIDGGAHWERQSSVFSSAPAWHAACGRSRHGRGPGARRHAPSE